MSNIYATDIPEVRENGSRFTSFQDEYSLATRKNEKDVVVIQSQLGLTPMTWGSLGQGILTGKYDSSCSFGKDDRRSRDIYVNFHGEKLQHNLRIVDVLRSIAAQQGKSVASVAIRFILDYLKGSIVLVGAKRPDQILSNAEAFDVTLDAAQLKSLLEVSDERR